MPGIDWGEPPLPPIEALQEIHECLLMVRYWRERAELAEAAIRRAATPQK